MGLLLRSNERIYADLAQCLAENKCSTNGSGHLLFPVQILFPAPPILALDQGLFPPLTGKPGHMLLRQVGLPSLAAFCCPYLLPCGTHCNHRQTLKAADINLLNSGREEVCRQEFACLGQTEDQQAKPYLPAFSNCEQTTHILVKTRCFTPMTAMPHMKQLLIRNIEWFFHQKCNLRGTSQISASSCHAWVLLP